MTPRAAQTKKYLLDHELELGTLFAAYGAVYLSSVIMGGWTPVDWGRDVVPLPLPQIPQLLPRSLMHPVFFVTSLPMLILGATLLCHCCLNAVRTNLTQRSLYAAVLLAVFGLGYIVVGAWPLQPVSEKLWQWKVETMSFGAGFAWFLTVLALAVLAVGCVGLWAHSKAVE